MMIWIVLEFTVGILGFMLDSEKSLENLFRNSLLGLVGALQGMVLSTILQAVPLFDEPLSPIVYALAGGILLLSVGKITKKAF